MNTVEVGPLQESEIPEFRRLAEVIWGQTYRGIISDEQITYMLNLIYSHDRIAGHINAGNPVFAARAGNTLVGYSHVLLDAHHSKLDKLYVEASVQRHGIGRLLLAAAERFAIQSDCSLMTLSVHKNNHRAIRAYGKYGFEIVATHREDIGNGFVMDDFILLKDLVNHSAS